MDIRPIIEIVAYNPEWPHSYEEEAAKIKELLGENCVTVHHIGSTAVPGLDAKPIIDIIVVVKNLLKLDHEQTKLQAFGYTPEGEHGIPFRRFFHKGLDIRTHNLHVYEEANPEIERHLHFRDFLRHEPQARTEYATLKRKLADQNPRDMEAYINGKESFIQNIDRRLPEKRLRLAEAATRREWAAVLHFGGKREDQNHIHMLLLMGVEIIGYARIQKSPLLLKEVILESSYEERRDEFLTLLDLWLTYQKANDELL